MLFSPFPRNTISPPPTKCNDPQCRFSEETYSEIGMVEHMNNVHPSIDVDYRDYEEDDALLHNNPKLSGKFIEY